MSLCFLALPLLLHISCSAITSWVLHSFNNNQFIFYNFQKFSRDIFLLTRARTHIQTHTLIKHISVESSTPICFSCPPVPSRLCWRLKNTAYMVVLWPWGCRGAAAETITKFSFLSIQYQLCIQGKMNNPPLSLFPLENISWWTHHLFSPLHHCTAEALTVGLQLSSEDTVAERESTTQGHLQA